MTDCKHDHSGDPVGADLCAAGRRIKNKYGIELAMVAMPVIMEGEGEGFYDPKVLAYSNVAGMALMVRCLIDFVMAQPRPVECKNCQEAYDELALARTVIRSKDVLERC